MSRGLESYARIKAQRGFTLIELVITTVIGVLVIAGLNGVVRTTLETQAVLEERIELMQQADFAIQRIVSTVSNSRRLLLPLSDNPNTNWPEHIREQTVPPSPPIGSSTLATARKMTPCLFKARRLRRRSCRR